MSAPVKQEKGVAGGDGDSGKAKTDWAAEEDNQLYEFGIDRDFTEEEWSIIAASFTEKPTVKSVKDRVAHLRERRKQKLERLGLHPVNQTKRKRSATALNDNDTAHAKKKPRIQLTVVPGAPTAAPMASWMSADGLAAFQAVEAALQGTTTGAAASGGTAAATASVAAAESGRTGPGGVGEAGLGGAGAAAIGTTLTATDGGETGAGGGRVRTVEDVEREVGLTGEGVADILVSMKHDRSGS